jgi:hypothetical protein
MGATRIAAISGLAADPCASLSPKSVGEASARATRLCRPLRSDPLTPQAIQLQSRHNQKVGTIGDPVDQPLEVDCVGDHDA